MKQYLETSDGEAIIMIEEGTSQIIITPLKAYGRTKAKEVRK